MYYFIIKATFFYFNFLFKHLQSIYARLLLSETNSFSLPARLGLHHKIFIERKGVAGPSLLCCLKKRRLDVLPLRVPFHTCLSGLLVLFATLGVSHLYHRGGVTISTSIYKYLTCNIFLLHHPYSSYQKLRSLKLLKIDR